MVLAGLALAAGSFPASAAERTAQLATTTTTVSVSASALYSDSKVYVRKGEQVSVRATGSWRHGTGTFGPGGNRSASTGPCKIVQLTGRVGLFGRTRCFTTAAVTFTSEADGHLLLWMNDGPGLGGTLSVTLNGGDPASTRPPSLPRPPAADPATFAQRCNTPFTFRNEDPNGARVFTDQVRDVPSWFRGIARDACSRIYKTRQRYAPSRG